MHAMDFARTEFEDAQAMKDCKFLMNVMGDIDIFLACSKVD